VQGRFIPGKPTDGDNDDEMEAEVAQAEEQQQLVRNKRGFSASRNAIDRADWPEGFVHRPHPLLQYS
jgi:hypothetical protein